MIRHRLLVFVVSVSLIVAAVAQKKAAPKAPSSHASKAAALARAVTGNDEQDIVDLERHLLDYIRAKNAKELEPWLGDDFQYTDARGNTSNREQYLNQVKSFPDNIDWLSADDLRVRVYGSVAVVTGVKQLRTSKGDVDIVAGPTGPPPSERSMAFTDVFRRLGSDWTLVQEFAANLPPKDAPAASPTASPAPSVPEPQQPAPKPNVDTPPKIARPQPPSER